MKSASFIGIKTPGRQPKYSVKTGHRLHQRMPETLVTLNASPAQAGLAAAQAAQRPSSLASTNLLKAVNAASGPG